MKKIFYTGPTRAAKAGQKSLVQAQKTQQINQGRTLFYVYALSPHSPQFQQSAGATSLSILWCYSSKYFCTLDNPSLHNNKFNRKNEGPPSERLPFRKKPNYKYVRFRLLSN
jgi:hypothetical protein